MEIRNGFQLQLESRQFGHRLRLSYSECLCGFCRELGSRIFPEGGDSAELMGLSTLEGMHADTVCASINSSIARAHSEEPWGYPELGLCLAGRYWRESEL